MQTTENEQWETKNQETTKTENKLYATIVSHYVKPQYVMR
jgi:hypothetical protein